MALASITCLARSYADPVVATALAPAVLAAPLERRVLEDGSIVELTRGAEIEVSFDVAHRRIRLLRGEANFTVGRNPTRPFLVNAGGVEVRAVGTVFNVALYSADVEVVVSEGRVVIKPAIVSPAATEDLLLSAGDRAVVPRMDIGTPQVAPLRATPTAAQSPRRSQRLEFNGTPLSEVVAAFNRRNPVQLVIGEPETGRMRVSGVFSSDNVEGFVRLLETASGITAERRGKWEIVLRSTK